MLIPISFDGYIIDTTVTDMAVDVEAWVGNIRCSYSDQQVIVGLDCKCRPNSINNRINNKTPILQLCVDTKCLIILLLYMDCLPQSLKNFLRDSNFTFVGVDIQKVVTNLVADHGLICYNIVDVREMARTRWGNYSQSSGLKAIARGRVGLSIPEPPFNSLSDWESRVLERSQIMYACSDAYASYRIGNFMLKGVRDGT